MARIHWLAGKVGAPNYFLLDYTVYPNTGSRDATDTLLVQFFVKMYFERTNDTGIDAERTRFNAIVASFAYEGYFIDGVYGPKTREAVLCFERATAAPYKDGIVRPQCEAGIVFADSIDYSQATKLEKMNWNFQQAFPNPPDKQAIVFAKTKRLYARLYQGD